MKTLKIAIKSFLLVFIFTHFIEYSLGCNRVSSQTSKIQIAVPKTMHRFTSYAVPTTAGLQHLIINVTGPGIANPFAIVWDKGSSNNAQCTATGSSCTLQIPTGSNRLFQALAVYKDSTTESMLFYYGDVVQSLANSTENVAITLAQLSSVTSPTQGQVIGRYVTGFNSGLTSLASGPTGNVNEYFDPGNGKPAMLIQTEAIMNGWFNLFMLYGAPFRYVVTDGSSAGTVLFGGPVDLSNPLFTSSQPGKSNLFRIDLPVRDEYSYNNSSNTSNGTPSWSHSEPVSNVYGWFVDPSLATADPNSASTYLGQTAVCNSGGLFPVLSAESKFNTGTAGSPSYLNPLSVSAGFWATAATNTSITAGPSPNSLANPTNFYYYYSGGTALGSGNCSSPSATADQNTMLTVTAANFDGHGNEHGYSAPIDPPFRKFANSSSSSTNPNRTFNVVESSPGISTISGIYLDGAGYDPASLVAYVGPSNHGGNSFSCIDLAGSLASQAGYLRLPTAVADLSGSTAATFSMVLNKTGFPTIYPNGFNIEICGAKNGVAIIQPFYIDSGSLSSGCTTAGCGPGTGSVLPASMALIPPQLPFGTGTNPVIFDNVCTPLLLQGYNSSAGLINMPGNFQLTAVTSALGTNYYKDPSCVSQISSSSPSNTNYYLNLGPVVYVKNNSSSAAGIDSLAVTASASNSSSSVSSLTSTAVPMTFTPMPVDSAGTTTFIETRILSSSVVPYQCFPVSYTWMSYSTSSPSVVGVTNALTSFSMYPTMSSVGNNFYADHFCTHSQSNSSLSSNNTVVYTMVQSASSSSAVYGTAMSTYGENITPYSMVNVSPASVNVVSAGNATGLQIQMNNQIMHSANSSPGNCENFVITGADAANNPSFLGAGSCTVTVTMQSGQSMLYGSYNCSSTASSAVSGTITGTINPRMTISGIEGISIKAPTTMGTDQVNVTSSCSSVSSGYTGGTISYPIHFN